MSIPDFIKALNPPPEGATERQLYVWRQIMALTSLATAGFLALHLMWTAGALPFFEGEGFAQKEEFAALVGVSMTGVIYELRDKQCRAQQGSDAKALYTEKVNEYVRKYEKLTGEKFRLPACDEL
jgi:hypothetical protein